MSWQKSLRGREREIEFKKVVVGFDGFIDTIVRPIRNAATADAPARPFSTIREFGEYLVSKAEKSCSLQLITDEKRAGGNLPNFSRAAGQLGLDVSCIGMLGKPGTLDDIFRSIPCKLYSFMEPGQSTCLEFSDGKVFLASEYPQIQDLWQTVCAVTGGKAPEMFRNADLLALVNWSELPFSMPIWEKVLECVAQAQTDRSRYAFFDLCDVSCRSRQELENVLKLIGRFTHLRTTVLSLNENEALVTAREVLHIEKSLVDCAQALRTTFGIDEVVVHTIRETILCTARGVSREATTFVEHPRISTGAGDNFNGAFCFATVMNLEDADRVAFANNYAHEYILAGRSPGLCDLING